MVGSRIAHWESQRNHRYPGWLVIVMLSAAPLQGQVPVVLDGRMVDANTGSGVQNAVVELVGHGTTLTSTEGTFSFDSIEPTEYVLRIDAFGYVSESLTLTVDRDRTVMVSLEVAPLLIDSLLVELRPVEVEGRVRDGEEDLPVVDAEILVNRAPVARTSVRGRFSLDNAWESVPLYMSVRAFGYLPMDTVLHPMDDDGTYEFELVTDRVMERMLDVEIMRIEDRAGGRRAITMRPLDRNRLLRWTGASLADVLLGSYPRFRLERVRCIVVDERVLPHQIDGDVLESMSPGNVERVEFLYRGAILRIYTRDFMKRMIAGQVELRPVTYVETPLGPPFCT